ncbi:MAG: oligopeptidase A [Betaproteobacteria bacterium]|nr:oligopeptidase A [Betaproteobacteria bacterium]
MTTLSPANNPLLQHGSLPLFDQIKPEHVSPAIDVLLAAAAEALETVTAPEFPAEWQKIAKVLDVSTERLSSAWGAVSHLKSVADTPELRAAYNEALPKVTEFWTQLGADERLYAKYKEVNPASLDAAQQQALKNALRNFVLGGAELQGEAKARYAAIQERMAELSQKFSENALDATDQFALYVDQEALEGVPEDVQNTAREAAEKEKIAIREPDPQAWDWPYIGEKLKEARYSFSEQEVKQYFTAPKVLQGLFKIIETLFEVSIRQDDAPVWHPAVGFYRLERNGKLLGQFYLDPPARAGKRGGAWMDDVRARWLRPDTQQLQTPVAHLVCNFAEGVDGQPPLLTHDDVITLFHEFGHGLHHMLTQVNERDVSGISGVEWDAVELPSQFMENFCWEWNVLKHMTAHVITGEALPRALFDKMVAAKNFQSGLQTVRQIELALMDMLLHCEHRPQDDFMSVLQKVRAEVAVIQAPDFNRMAHTFSHIFAGGYAAGYYSYKWAEVLSADAYAAFEETAQPDGSPSLETGRRYREAILEAGGSRPALASFVAFRGREPTLNALLRHQGMTAPQASISGS